MTRAARPLERRGEAVQDGNADTELGDLTVELVSFEAVLGAVAGRPLTIVAGWAGRDGSWYLLTNPTNMPD